jgi:hypothetical protein
VRSSRSPNLSLEERARRSTHMRALNADPAIQAKRSHGKRCWTEEGRQAAAARLEAQRNNPEFLAAQRAARETAKLPPLKLPQHTLPIVRGLFVGMNDQRATFGDVSKRSGVSYDTLRRWRKHMPHVDMLEAALNTLDLELAIVPMGTRDDNGFIKKKIRNRGVEP